MDLARVDKQYADVAIERLRQALRLRGSAHARNRTLDMASLAEALVLAGELDEAARTAALGLAQISEVTSGRLVNRLGEISRSLSPYRDKSASIASYLAQFTRQFPQPRLAAR